MSSHKPRKRERKTDAGASPGPDRKTSSDPDAARLLEQVKKLQDEDDKLRLLGFMAGRKFTNHSWAGLAAGMIMETDLPKYDRELLGDLIKDTVADKSLRKKILDYYAVQKQLKKRGKR